MIIKPMLKKKNHDRKSKNIFLKKKKSKNIIFSYYAISDHGFTLEWLKSLILKFSKHLIDPN